MRERERKRGKEERGDTAKDRRRLSGSGRRLTIDAVSRFAIALP